MPQQNTLSCLIVDDERSSRNELEDLLVEYCPEVYVVGKASSALEARALIAELQPDLIFLDVRMPDESGFDLLETLSEQPISVVFISGYEEYAVEAFKTAALHYLIKPCQPEELKKAVKRVLQGRAGDRKANNSRINGKQLEALVASNAMKNDMSQEEDRIIVAHRTGFKILRISDINFLKSCGNYTEFHLTSGDVQVASRAIGYFEKQLPDALFFRIHRSYLINLDHLEGYESQQNCFVELRGNVKLEVSRRKLKSLMDRVLSH